MIMQAHRKQLGGSFYIRDIGVTCLFASEGGAVFFALFRLLRRKNTAEPHGPPSKSTIFYRDGISLPGLHLILHFYFYEQENLWQEQSILKN